MKKGDHLFLVDGSGYIFRAYHALPPLNRKSDGLPPVPCSASPTWSGS
jgi:DNA polymerase I